MTYDFWGFPQRYYEVTYDAPGAPDLAARIEALIADNEPVDHDPDRRLDHGAYVPLTVMYPDAAIPVLQISMPTLDPERLLRLGERLRPLRDEGVLIIGSGFTTHGLPFLDDASPDASPPDWSTEFDVWARERFAAGDVTRSLTRQRRPACRTHTRPSSTSPLFVAAHPAIRQSPKQCHRRLLMVWRNGPSLLDGIFR